MQTRSFRSGTLIATASLVVGMVIAARLDLTPGSFAGPFSTPAVNSSPITGAIDATTFRNIARDASPAVVSISVKSTRPVRSLGDLFGLQEQRRGQTPAPRQYSEGAGSGFIIDKAGLILTNNHVIDDALSIDVSFGDARGGEAYPAEIVGRDELTDTALIRLTKLPDHPLTEIKFGDSSQMAPGDWVMAIGNPFQLSNSVSVGIVSAVGRPHRASTSANGQSARFEEMIQTDAAINHGNSGGPLLNIRGEVIGMNTMIYSNDSAGGNIGIGFAVPINRVVGLLPQLRAGKITRGRIGVALAGQRITKEDAEDRSLPSVGGAIVSDVDEGPAKTAGMKRDDVVIEFNGKPVQDNESLIAMVTSTTPGTTVPVRVVRDRKMLTFNVKVDELDLAQEQGVEMRSSAARSGRADGATKDAAFGMRLREITPADARRMNLSGKPGAVVESIDPLGQAAQSGLLVGDVILSINGQPTTDLDAVDKALEAVQPRHTARLLVTGRGGERLVLVRKR